jgi:hypothetical protein
MDFIECIRKQIEINDYINDLNENIRQFIENSWHK